MSNACGFKVIKIYWLETSVYYTYVFTKQMQYKKLNQMRFVSINTSNRTYEMATEQFNNGTSSNAHFWLRPTHRIFFVFIIYSYTIPIDSFPFLWRKSHQSHCCLYACLCNQLHVFKRWSSRKLESFCLVYWE